MRRNRVAGVVTASLLGLVLSLYASAPAEAQTVLASGVPVQGSVGAWEWVHYRLDAPAGGLLMEVRTAGTTGDVDLYIRYGAQPTMTDYDYRPYRSSGNEWVFVTPASTPRPLASGPWYISVMGVDASPYTLTATLHTSPNLTSGNPVQGSVEEGGWRMYCLSVPEGATSLTIATTGTTGDLDLYLLFGDAPTLEAWDYRPYGPTGDETVTVTPTSAPRPLQAGTWYAGISGYMASSYTLSATVVGGATCALSCSASAPPTGVAGTPVAFASTATATGCAGSPTFAWTFGDGQSSSQQNPTHAYAAAGTYSWSLTASADGRTCTRTGSLVVSQAPTCTLSCTASAPATAQVGSPVSFASTATPANCSGSPTFAWTFGDGGSSSQQNPTHAYAAAGTYSWSLTASVAGVTCSKFGSISVTSGGTCTVPGDCDGSGTVSIGEVQKAINMFLGLLAPSCCVDSNGDGTVSIGEVQRVINAFLGGGTPVAVTVSPASASLAPGGTQQFTAAVTGTANTAVTWSVQEGAAGGSVTQAGLYEAPQADGTYHVVATSQADPSAKGTAAVTVQSGGGTCAFDCEVTAPAMARAGEAASFSCSVVNAHCSGTLTFEWDFGDGTSSALQSPTHAYQEPGMYIWSLAVLQGVLHCYRTGVLWVVPPTCGAGLTVNPAAVTLPPLGAQAFAATLGGLPAGDAIQWCVVEGDGGGMVGSSGEYLAGATEGVYHLLAVKRDDPTVCGVATVNVQFVPEVTDSQTGTVGTGGGSVLLSDGTGLEFPPGAVASPVQVTLSKVANDPFYAGGNHTILSYQFSGPVSAATLRVPVVPGVRPDRYAAVMYTLDSPAADLLDGTLDGTQSTFRADLRLGEERAVTTGFVGVEVGPGPPGSVGRKVLKVPYFDQDENGDCWAAVWLDFLKAYTPDVSEDAIYELLRDAQIDKNEGIDSDVICSWWSSSWMRQRTHALTGRDIVRNTWWHFPNFLDYVVTSINRDRPLMVNMIHHQGLMVGYETFPDGSVAVLYHDPNAGQIEVNGVVYDRYPYQYASASTLHAQFWLRSYGGRIFNTWMTWEASAALPDERPLQTIHFPDTSPANREFTEDVRGRGVYFLQGNAVVGVVPWDHTAPSGLRLTGRAALNRPDIVPLDGPPPTFTALRVKKAPIWNADYEHDVPVVIRTSVHRYRGGVYQVPALWESELERTLPAYDDMDPLAARYQHDLFIPFDEFSAKLLPEDGGQEFALVLTLLDGAGERIESHDYMFRIQGPLITSAAPDTVPVGGELLLEGYGFGAMTAGISSVSFSDGTRGTVDATQIVSWSDSKVRVKVPPGADDGPVMVRAATQAGAKPSNAYDVSVDGVWDPNQTEEVSFYVFRRNGSSRQASQNFTIQILRDGQVVDGGTAVATNGLWETTLRVGTTYGFVVDATWTYPDATAHLTGSFQVLPDRTNWIDIEKPAAAASVSIWPTSATLPLGGSKTFYAVCTTTGTQTGVTWSVEEVGGGTASALDDGVGSYRAPQVPGTYHLRATSVADGGAYARATLTVTSVVGVELAPESLALPPGGQAVFTASVTGASNEGVTWTATGGSLTPGAGGTATYAAPGSSGTYTVTATSQADPTKKDTATVRVLSDATVTLTYGGTVEVPYLSNSIRIPGRIQASGSVTAPVLPGGDGTLVVPEWDGGEAGPLGGRVMTGCRGVPGTVQVNGTTTYTPLANSYQAGSTVYTIKGVTYETCRTTDQNANGSWSTECSESSSLSATVSCAGGTGGGTRILVEIEETRVGESGEEGARAVTYTVPLSGAAVAVDVW